MPKVIDIHKLADAAYWIADRAALRDASLCDSVVDPLRTLSVSWVVLVFDGGGLDPRCVQAATADEALRAVYDETGATRDHIHGVYPGYIGMNALES